MGRVAADGCALRVALVSRAADNAALALATIVLAAVVALVAISSMGCAHRPPVVVTEPPSPDGEGVAR